ncbi:hypothetical protein LINPERPRIM_LOCUS38545, partial [Linum perenne]
ILDVSYFLQVIDELKQYVHYTSELETTILTAREEITSRDFEILHLKQLLNKTTKERNDARIQCQRLMLDNSILHHKAAEEQQQQPPPPNLCLKQESPPLESSPEEQCGTEDNNVDMVEKLASERELPEKGKLLQAVKEAGPLLQTLMLAGPLPQWQNPPPPLHNVDIPPVTMSSASSSSSPKLIHQESFNSTTPTPSLSIKRSFELCESPNSSSPNSNNKLQKLDHLPPR